MSDRVIQSISNGETRQTLESYQPVWMARWIRTSSAERRNHSADGLLKGSADEVGKFEAVNTTSLRMSSKSLANWGFFDSPLEYRRHPNGVQENRPMFFEKFRCGEVADAHRPVQLPYWISHNKKYFSTSCFTFYQGTTSANHLELITACSSARHRNAFKDAFLGSSSRNDKAKDAQCPLKIRPYTAIKDRSPKDKMINIEQEDGNGQIPFSNIICERETVSHSVSNANIGPCVWDCKKSSLQESFRKVQMFSSVNLHPRQLTVQEKTESENYDLKTMRICTKVDPVALAGTSEAYPRFTERTHRLVITADTEANPSEGNDFVSTTQLISRNGNTSSHLHSLSPLLFEGNRGLKLQELSSCSSEEKRDLGHVGTTKVTTKNESSAETNTMDLGLSTDKKSNSSGNSAPSSMAYNDAANSSPQIRITSSKEVVFQRKKAVFPDVSLSLSILPAVADSSGNKSTSSSRTRCLDRDTLLSHAKLLNPESNLCPDDSSKGDPTNRWVKRLKLSCSNSSGQGTRTSIFSENLSHEKMRKFSTGFHGIGMSSSEQSATKRHGKEPIFQEKIQDLSKEDKPLVGDQVKKSKELLLSCSWIKRLLTNGSNITQDVPETVVCDPQSSKLALDDPQKKQFPSIAAMALSGKVMSGYQSFELRKNGYVTVWNKKDL